MSKHTRQIKAAKDSNLARVEHTETFDDHLLPDALEIEKLARVDPNILDWLKQRAEREQEFRHSTFDKRVNLTDRHNKRDHNTARWALFVYFMLVMGCIAASYFLIMNGKNTQGTIFGSAAVILALAVLLTRKQDPTPKKDSK